MTFSSEFYDRWAAVILSLILRIHIGPVQNRYGIYIACTNVFRLERRSAAAAAAAAARVE